MITFHGPNGKITVNIDLYSDNTPLVKHDRWDEIVRSKKMTVTAHSLMELTTAMFLADSIEGSGGHVEDLILPYLPGARQDRINPTGDVLSTAWSVAQMVNQRYFQGVHYVDPHSEAMPSFLYGGVEFPLERVYSKLWRGYGGVIAPDKGALRRAEIAHGVIGGELLTARKTRDVYNGHITGYEVDAITPGRHYLVVDDICDGGRTFLTLGEEIRKAGAFADLFVTHGIFSHNTRALRQVYKNIYTTDTLIPKHPAGLYRIRILEDMEKYA